MNDNVRRRREDDEKLIPGWGLAADWQIIVLGLIVVAAVLGSTLVWPALFGGDDSTVEGVLPDLDTSSEEVIEDSDAESVSPVTTTTQTETTVAPDVEVDLTPDVAAAVSGFAGITGFANGSIATLEGFVGTTAESVQAENEALAVDGITGIDNRLIVLEQSVLDAANGADAGVSDASVVMNGTSATLRGLVSNALDAASAIAAAEAVEGVSPPVINELRILQPLVDEAVSGLNVVEGGESVVETDPAASPISRVVTLTGSVDSEEDSAAAEAAARSVEGVTEVVNLLEVVGPTDEDITTELNQLFDLEPIQFRSGSDEILAESLPTLDSAVRILREAAADIRLEVQGYTDTSGGDQANQRLSERRAAAVRDYLVEGGVNADALTSRGFGETTQFGTELADNRRVRFALL